MPITRRHFIHSSLALSGSTLLAACGSTDTPQTTPTPQTISPMHTPSRSTIPGSDNSMRLFASSGFCEDPSRIQRGLDLLSNAGFAITNHLAAYRRFQRFAGTDAERIADLQEVATGRVATPKVLMGVRGGYGAARLLPHIDWVNLGARMKERQTLLFGFSDVTAIQLALLAQGGMSSFAGPMLYSEFAKSEPNPYTMDSFTRTSTSAQTRIVVSGFQAGRPREAAGTLWGGNLSMLASLVGTPYMPDIRGGLLFLEDVSEQPYRIERMLQTLHLAGILRKQQAIILGDFRMGNIRDTYDTGYDLTTVAQTISRAAGIPVYSGFPFGHIANKASFPLGAHARLQPDSSGYTITFSGYPTLDAGSLNLAALMPPPAINLTITHPANDSSDSEF